MYGLKKALLLFILTVGLFHCQHARIRIPPPLPEECKPWSEKQYDPTCQEKRQSQKNEWESFPVLVKEYEQKYFFWGLKPSDIYYKLDEECPNGVKEIYQYSTLKDAVYEQLTIGIYSPRTLRLTCYESKPIQPTKPTPGKKR